MNNLTEVEIRALHEALDDEYRAWSTYDQVMADFGETPPFVAIREAEARHIEALRALFGRYRLAVPENPWPGKIARYATLRAACEAGVEAEIANGAMYSRLLKATRRPDMLGVFHALKDASQQRHLPAFQRGVERTGNAGTGWGATRRRRGGNRA